MTTTTATITSAGLNVIAAAMQGVTGAAASPSVTYVAVGTGAGLLSAALTNGTVYTTLSLQAGLPANIASNQSLTIVNGATSQTVTTNGTQTAGATSITVNSFMASANFAIGSGVVNTPAATDTQLQNETLRKTVSGVIDGAGAGESLFSMYIGPTDLASMTLLEVGYFAGNASGSANSGTLLARAIYWYPHVFNADSGTAQLDITI